MASRMERKRGGWSAAPSRNKGKRCSSRVSNAAGGKTRTQAAASSIASGSPSNCRHMATTASALSAVKAKPA